MADPAGNETLAALEAKTGGRPNHFFRMMARRPEVLKSFPALYGAIVGPGSVDNRTKELVYLATSYANQCLYCATAHEKSSAKAGVTADDQRAIREEQNQRFTEPERAALDYARELTRTGRAAVTRDALQRHFTEEQVVELTLVAAMANFTNRFNNALQVMPEA
jgi:uncharacterized peroxidase-related enzyme